MGAEFRPTETYPIFIADGNGGYLVREARWWLIPAFWSKPIKEWRAPTFNARIEEAAEKPSFRGPWRSRHCLVPVASLWEWSGEHPEDRKKKQRHCITRGDNQPMILAGLWDHASTAEGEVTSFTILTRAARADMAPLHDREPVVLSRDQWKPWMECQSMPELITPAPQGLLRTAPEMRSFA